MKKLLAILIAALLCAGMTAVAEETYTVGICQLVQHPALDAATQGFQDALAEKLPGAVIHPDDNKVPIDRKDPLRDQIEDHVVVPSFSSQNKRLLFFSVVSPDRSADRPIIFTDSTPPDKQNPYTILSF